MSSFRPGVFNTLVCQDIYYSLKSARGLLFLVFFSVFWLWVLWKLSSGNAKMLSNAETGFILSLFIDPKVIQSLFVGRAPTFSAYFYLAMSSVPMFVLLAASDQTANDIGSKYLRFLTPRCNRLEIFVGRFFGATILISFAYILVTIIAALISMAVDNNGVSLVLADLPLVLVSLVLYLIPFVAFMSLCSVIVGSAGLSALMGVSVYVVMLVIISVIGIKSKDFAEVISYIIPNSTKFQYLQLSWVKMMGASLLVPVYVVAYGLLGWMIFSKRDI